MTGAEGIIAIAPESRATRSAGLAVERADARVRAVASAVLRDVQLRNDAHRRDEAADRREAALHARAAPARRTGVTTARKGRLKDANTAKTDAAQYVKQERDRAASRRKQRETIG